jgi:rubrerythrin
MTRQKDNSKQNSEHLTQAYDHMLQRVEETLGSAMEHSGNILSLALDNARDKAVELGELTREEADKVREFISADLYDAGRYLAIEEREVTDWLRLNLLLVEKDMLHRFTNLAQAARLELKHLGKTRQRLDEWHTGEVTTIGTLRCRQCGEIIHFERTGRIPPCPKCHATVFERAKD